MAINKGHKKGQWEKSTGLLRVLFVLIGSPARTRTTDKLINSQLLYRLSYWGINSRTKADAYGTQAFRVGQ
jgi:hypothetical protein